MNKLAAALNPEVTKLLLKSYSVVKKRPALWFFKNEVLEKIKSERLACEDKETTTPMRPYLRRQQDLGIEGKQIKLMWKEMNPESKRRYFDLAEFDGVRYKEQKILWMAEIASLLLKHGDEIKKLTESIPDLEDRQAELLKSLKKHQGSCTNLIQIGSTKMLYKSVINSSSEKLDLSKSSEEMISVIPDTYRQILCQPKKPPPPFLVFRNGKKEELKKLRDKQQPGMPLSKFAGIEWNKLDKAERSIYEEEYLQYKNEYLKESQQFKTNISKLDSSHLLYQATKERKLLSKAFRRRLREFDVVPVNMRNAFNFFVKDNKHLPLHELLDAYRDLSEEDKAKYKQMAEEDKKRYHDEKLAYKEFMQKLGKLLEKVKNTNTKYVNEKYIQQTKSL